MPRDERPVQLRRFNDVVGYADKDDMSLDQLRFRDSFRLKWIRFEYLRAALCYNIATDSD